MYTVIVILTHLIKCKYSALKLIKTSLHNYFFLKLDSGVTPKIKRDSGFSGKIIRDSGFREKGGYTLNHGITTRFGRYITINNDIKQIRGVFEK